MSPEVNGNPPNITKRKKNREKKTTGPETMHNFDLNMPGCNYFPLNYQYPYNNIPVPEIPNYYSFMNCPNQSEPKSLPVYPINYSGGYNNCPMGSAVGNISRHSMRSNHTFNVHHASDMADDYTSLPIVNAEDDNENSKRPFSDPGLPNDSDSGSSLYDENVHKLTKQIQILNENNNKLSREVMELRIELNLLKQQQTNNRHYEREYEPGMLADVIREVRDAARVREDALLARVKHIIEEKQLNVNQLNFVTEKNRNTDRISALEDQLKNLSVSNNNNLRSESSINSIHSSTLCLSDDKNNNNNNNSARQVFQLEREALELRRDLEDTRAKKEEADQKLKRYSNMFKRGEISISDPSEDGKTSVDSLSTVTTTSSVATPRIVLSGPITSL